MIATVIDTTWTGSEDDGLAQAQINAEAAYGLVARHLGVNAVREEIVLAHNNVALPGRPDEIRISLNVQVPNFVNDADLETLDFQVTSLLDAPSKREELDIALRWYLHGLTSTNIRDRLIAHYIGVEALLVRHTKSLVSIASIPANDETHPKLLQPLVEKHGQQAVDALIARGRVPNPPDWQRMEQYSTEHRWDEEPAKMRKRTRDARNPSLHGTKDKVTVRDADAAQALLELFLDTELNDTTA